MVKPIFSSSAMRFSALGVALISPVRPTSPKTATLDPTGVSVNDDKIAVTMAKSIDGSENLRPPIIEINISLDMSLRFKSLSMAAIMTLARLGATPKKVRLAITARGKVVL